MSDSRRTFNRRTALKSAGVLIGGTGLMGTASARGGSTESAEQQSGLWSSWEMGATWEPAKDEISLASEEFEALSDNVDKEGVAHIGSLAAKDDVYSEWTGIHVGTTESMLHFFRGDEPDEEGRNLYYVLFWAVGSPRWFAKVREIESRISLPEDEAVITGFAPDEDLSADCTTKPLSVGSSYGGTDMSVSTDIELCAGSLGPSSDIGLSEWGLLYDGGWTGSGLGYGVRQFAKGALEFRSEADLDEADLEGDFLEWTPSCRLIIV